MKKRLPIHLKAWGVLIGSVLILLTVLPSYGYAALVGYWPFEEATGSVALDASGNGNNGDIHGATRVQGKCGGGLTFGGDSYVLVPRSDSIDVGTWTISCWVSFANLNSDQVILDKRNGYHLRNYSLVYYPNASPPVVPPGDYLAALIGGGSCPSTWDCGTYQMENFTQDHFYHLAATYDGSMLKLYVNGALIALRTMNISGITGNGALYIGAPGDLSGSEYFHGVIDEVRIYNDVLTQEQILADMQTCAFAPAVSGCLKVKGAPLDDTKVVLWQWLRRPQVTRTDEHGCFEFGNVVSGKNFWLTIGGPEGSN